jgi:uncharacterized protein (TIGR00297 family)
MDSLIFILIILIGMAGSYFGKKLTLPGAITGGILAAVIYFASGWSGVCMMTLFFILGTLATSWKHSLKESLHIAEENKGRRNAQQVFANAGIAGIICLFILFYPKYTSALILMMAAAFSSATADTVSSELGSVYGKKFYNIITGKKDIRGLNGVISIEGCLWGLAGSIAIGIIYSLFEGWGGRFFIVVLAGTSGNLFDSFLGATVERTGRLKNNAVNFLNTLFAAMVAGVFILLS